MNLNQIGVRYNVQGDMVNMTPQEQEAAMMNRKALLKPIRKARWLRRQEQAKKAA